MTSGSNAITIGEVARAVGVNTSTVRYYDEIGLIEALGRSGGKRIFLPETVGRVNFIRRAREVGFSLEEIGRILDDQSGSWRGVVEEKLAELNARRTRLDLMIALLEEVRVCGCEVVASCPKLATGEELASSGAPLTTAFEI